jgi:hypothetical protein
MDFDDLNRSATYFASHKKYWRNQTCSRRVVLHRDSGGAAALPWRGEGSTLD